VKLYHPFWDFKREGFFEPENYTTNW